MASTTSHIHLSLMSLFTLILLVQARLNICSPDYSALLLVQKGLDVSGQRSAIENPCNSVGISCERRLTNNSYMLRVTGVVFKSYELRGTLSPAIGKLSELKELSLQNNNLFDRIPTQIVECRKLEILSLQNNQFSGKVPSELSSLVHLRILDLSSNELSGNLNFLKYFPNLEKLSLADNMFTGKIPQSLKSFRNLWFLNISGNSFLEGPVPFMSQLEHLSADLNRKDYVPKRYILAENSTRSSHKSAMAPQSYSGNAPAPGPSAIVVPVHKHNKTKKKRGSKDDSGVTIFSPLIKKAEDLAFLENVDGLALLEKIRKGGCGEVYKAELPGSNGKIIAIKKIVEPPKDAAELTEEDSKALNIKMRQIKSEIKIVGQIRHRNLLPLLAHMPRPDCHYLVYEYMKNGSLHDAVQQVTEGTREIDWSARHRIAVGIATGLEYLHVNHSQRIIHRDLKPANVLLDDDMEARIADFGLAKAIPESLTHVSTSHVVGTLGYIAPAYYQTVKFTDKCDIYSFGVLLGVLVMGKFPSDELFQPASGMGLVKWMRNVMTSENPKRAIDPKLMGNGYEEQMLLVLKIACFCTLDNPKERPNSKDVRCMLTQIKP
ncbi:leucine-rich repeat receptor-like serinethreonine/tyrosine-protein kinase sobir1 [Nicotiana attenuata]|uniref:Leucine-rich repeat receptor-like serinethreonine/tyrosine-protein kinase sobir1 n=1 Tax=Nicotiana attenuata TaxID=49451 RepID=A0A314KS23_NICAT|nr:leucine-rich repeat receptor-like serinethreonine/tyrosine-protein kinase sobir1 [Nicotiana attenuata]